MSKTRNAALEVAIAGISAALALIGIVLYYYVPMAKITFLALSGVALVLPLCIRKERSSLLAYLAAGGIGIAIVSPVMIVPFAFLFGWQPFVMGICERYLAKKPYLTIPIKATLFNAGLFGVYTLYGLGDTIANIQARFGWELPYWAVALAGTALWIGYDYLMLYVWRWLEKRLRPVLAKYTREKPEDVQEDAGSEKGADEDPFASNTDKDDTQNGSTYPENKEQDKPKDKV